MKPIVLSDADVKAILAGRKTQVRRIIKPQPRNGVRRSNFVKSGIEDLHGYEVKSKYLPDDILWIKETWSKDQNGDYVYQANYGITEDDTFPPSLFKWRSPIYMPKEAARLFLKVTAVWIERLQSITEENAWAEGLKDPYDYQDPAYYEQKHMQHLVYHIAAYAGFWDKANAKRGYPWESNPWVWVIEFERSESPHES